MADLPQSSFIPKRSTPTPTRRSRRYNFYLLSIVSYALFIAAPVASAGVFVYEKYTERALTAAISDLNTAINDFSLSDLQTVVEFDNRLKGATDLMNSHVSLITALAILEQQTAQTVAFENLELLRVDRSTLTITGALSAEDFDAAIFQREQYDRSALIGEMELSDLTFTPPSDEGVDGPDISMNGTFAFSADTIRFTPLTSSDTSTMTIEPEVTDTTESATTTSDTDTADDEATDAAETTDPANESTI